MKIRGLLTALLLASLAAPAMAQFGGNTSFGWYSAGPFGFSTRLTALVADPRSTTTILIGSSGGGIWRSLDTGANWASLTDSAPTLQICSLALDPANPDNIYAGTGDPKSLRPNLGVMRSSNGGRTGILLRSPPSRFAPLPSTPPTARTSLPHRWTGFSYPPTAEAAGKKSRHPRSRK